MISATINTGRILEKLNGSSGKVLAALNRTLNIQVGMLANYIRENKLSGQVLKNQTGNLRNSIVPLVEVAGPILTGKVYVDSSAPYGAYQEYGAQIPERVPVNAKALRWYVGGAPIFAMRARAFTLPPRPFMSPSLDEKSAQITEALQTSADTALKT